ncbi:MAG: class I SAM-dependent methyltransferase [Parvularculaceae bacterium]
MTYLKKLSQLAGVAAAGMLAMACAPGESENGAAQSGGGVDMAAIEAAVANEMRTPENAARDADRKPAEVIAFFEIEPGETVLDLFSGGGYYTEILSGVVGPEGVVYAHQTANERFEQNREALEAQFAPFGNIVLLPTAAGEPFALEDGSVDTVIFVNILHHFHYDETTPDERPERATALYSEVMRVLKPGGVFGVVEHEAVPGASRQQTAEWHRITRDQAVADITGAGFILEAEADIHRNPDDDMANAWFDAGLRGKTNRIVHRYVKPE